MSKKKYHIAIVLFGFYESGLSLAQALSEQGHYVDVYSFSSRLNSSSAGFGFEYETKWHYRLPGHLYEIDYSKSKGVSFASSDGNSHVYIMQSTMTGVSRHGTQKRILEFISKFFLKRIAKKINKKNYDLVEIVSQDYFSRHLYTAIRAPQVHSFHEVSDVVERDNKKMEALVELSVKRGDNIRVYSEKSADTFKLLYKKKYSKLYIVPFGLFTNYKDFGDIRISEMENERDYILYFGLIVPYKGISVLYEAMLEFWKTHPNVKCVVAGKGNDAVLDKMKADSRFVIFNRLLTNDEVVYFIKRSKFLVCPYLKASQSGLPQTAYVFGKPIVATNVGAFPDVISQGNTGLLVSPNNATELCRAMAELYDNTDTFNRIAKNLQHYETFNEKISWQNIANQYIEMIKKIHKNYEYKM